MAKIKLFESLRSIKRTTIRYNGLKIKILLIGSKALKSIRQLIVVIFSLKEIFKLFRFEGSSKLNHISIIFQMPLDFNLLICLACKRDIVPLTKYENSQIMQHIHWYSVEKRETAS